MSLSRRLSELAVVATATVALGAALWPLLVSSALEVSWGEKPITLLSPQWLGLNLLAPYLLWVSLRSLTNFPLPQQLLSLLVRLALVFVISVALSRPSEQVESSRISAVALVDVSDSATSEAIDEAQAFVRRAFAMRDRHELQLVAFDGRARKAPLRSEENLSGEKESLEREGAATAGTDLQAALQLAYGLLSPHHLRRVALFSDGLETQGDVLAEAGRAAELGVRLDYRPYRSHYRKEVAIRDLKLPEAVRVGEPFEVEVEVFSGAATSAELRLYQDEKLNGLQGIQQLQLEPGVQRVTFASVAHVAGPVTYRAVLEPAEGDRFATNNAFVRSIEVPGRPSVLYIEGTPAQATYLARALSRAKFNAEVRPPAALPPRLTDLHRFDFIVLSDVPAASISAGQMAALQRYVRNFGGGLLLSGGEDSYGLGGWQETPLASMSPVRMDAERRRDQPSVALGLVLDKSGSMNGAKIELAKEAAKATAEMLGPDDYISVVGFDSQPARVVRMQSARNRIGIVRDIGRLAARGGTAIFPALDMAYQDLSVTRAAIKHVILLTDGQAPEKGIDTLVRVMQSEGITVSTVGLGSDVNRNLLQQVAEIGAGRVYLTNDPHNVPRIFMKETHTVARSSAVEEYFRPVVSQRADFLEGIAIGNAPLLRGFVATQSKPPPTQVVLVTESGEPLLARWRYGLGWVVAWTSDVKSRWASQWVRWRQFSQFWGQLVREHMRRNRQERLPMQATVQNGKVHVVVDAIDDADRFINELRSTVSLRGPIGTRNKQQAPEQTELRQVAPGRYEAQLPLNGFGSYILTAIHYKDGKHFADSEAQVAWPYPEEFDSFEPDLGLLHKAAALTGGGLLEQPQQLFDPAGQTVQAPKELWPQLVLLALVLFVIDLLLRRVRLLDRRAGSGA